MVRKKKMWLVKLLEQLGVKWVAALIIATVGGLGVINNMELSGQRDAYAAQSVQLQEEFVLVDSANEDLQRQLDSLKVVVSMLANANYRKVRRLRRVETDLAAMAPKPSAFQRFGSALGSLWPWGRKENG